MPAFFHRRYCAVRKTVFLSATVQRLPVITNARPSSCMNAASAAAFARPDVGPTVSNIAILAVLLVLLTGAAWMLVT